MSKEILIIAGEASGDMHAASLMREMHRLGSGVSFCGIGGDRMKAEGLDALYHISQMSFLGFVEVIKHLPFIREVRSKVLSEVKSRGIETAILIDYPGFNLNIAKKLRQMNVRVVYYISPQVWAWGKNRIEKIKALVDELIVILPFEEKFFAGYGIKAHYAGNPLTRQLLNYNYLSREELYAKFRLEKDKDILLLLPGSRTQEVRRIFPETIVAADRLARDFNMQVVVACSDNIDERALHQISPADLHYKTIKGHTYDLFRHSRLGIIKSGTSTLEAGLSGLPMVVVYSTSYLTYLIGRLLLKIRMIALVNIVLGEMVVPELIQKDVSRDTIYNVCRQILKDPNKYKAIKTRLDMLRHVLGEEDASASAAKIITDFISRPAN